MYKLTERRFQNVEHHQEEYRQQLKESGMFVTGQLEHEMREALGFGYQTLKDIMLDIVKRYPRFWLVALYYMQHDNPMGPVCEFQSTLAEAYGLDYYFSEDREFRQTSFWESQLEKLRSQDAA